MVSQVLTIVKSFDNALAEAFSNHDARRRFDINKENVSNRVKEEIKHKTLPEALDNLERLQIDYVNFLQSWRQRLLESFGIASIQYNKIIDDQNKGDASANAIKTLEFHIETSSRDDGLRHVLKMVEGDIQVPRSYHFSYAHASESAPPMYKRGISHGYSIS